MGILFKYVAAARPERLPAIQVCIGYSLLNDANDTEVQWEGSENWEGGQNCYLPAVLGRSMLELRETLVPTTQ
jgi:hypothetical protein